MGTASIFDSISTGNILSDIGNTGLQSDDVAAMFVSIQKAEEERRREAEVQAQRERQRRLVIGGSIAIGLILLIIIIFLIQQKINNRG